MANRKITKYSFAKGEMHRALGKEMREANLGPAARKRVEMGLAKAVENIEQKKGLRYGVSGQHAEEMNKFLRKKYEERRDLKPKEREVIKSSLDIFFKRPLEKKVEPKVEVKAPPKAVPRFVPKAAPKIEPALAPRAEPKPFVMPEAPQSITLSPSSSDSTSEEPISFKNDEGSDIKSAP